MATSHLHDLAISAVAYDERLVAELISLLAGRLESSPIWSGSRAALPELEPLTILEDQSRIALVLAQRLWAHDRVTAQECERLRERVRKAPSSVIVITLDDDPLPAWMRRLRHRRLETVGIEDAAEFVLQAIADAGGAVTQRPSAAPVADPSLPESRWPQSPIPYLRQPRAHSALRRELDSLCDALETPVEEPDSANGERVLELQKLPNRIVARLDRVGVSFSWVPGRAGTVADGRLMVIEWADVTASRGNDAFRTARATRERVYCVEAANSDDWYWRTDGPNGRACSTVNLVGEWMDGATMMAESQRST